MILKSVDVILLFEHVSRELDSLLVMKFHLEALGFSVEVLPIHYNRYWHVVKYRPKFVVLPYCYSVGNPTRELYESVHKGVAFLNLHHEQFYNEGTKEHLIPSDDYSKNMHHITWADSFANDLRDVGVRRELIHTTGNPRTDTFFLSGNQQVRSVLEGYSKMVFVPTTFSWALVDESYFLSISAIDKDEFKHRRAITLASAKAYFHDFHQLAKLMPNTLFVLRPHPFEDLRVFEGLYQDVNGSRPPDNLIISREGNVYDWLKYCSLTVGWCTTVNMEAALFNIPSVVYHPTEYPRSMDLEFFSSIHIVKNRDSLIELIDTPEKASGAQDFQQFCEGMFGLGDGKVSSRISHVIKDNMPQKTSI